MANAPFRRGTPKIGRNDPCTCGSGRKFKHCHGRPQYELPYLIAAAKLEKHVIAEAERQIERKKAEVHQRQKQQGLGRPIISLEHKGYRFVAVGNRVLYGKWKTFIDFLGDYMKMTIGQGWGNAEIAKPLAERHPILQWYDKIAHLQMEHQKTSGAIYSTPMTGAVSAYYRLAYNLYLLAHNGADIQTRLLGRLKNKDNFQGAYYETQVAAWLIKAGFELEFEDEDDRQSKHCEFAATYPLTGEKCSVEAKSREIETDRAARPKVGRKLYEALQKAANHKRVIFIDLNKPLHTSDAADRAIDRAERIVQQSEATIKINGEPAPPAYVCITNMNDQYALDTSALATMISFHGFKIGDFMGVEFPSIRAAIRARERHWPMFQLFKSMEEHREIPRTFSGELPSEVFAENPLPRIRVGDFFAVPGPDGHEVNARIENAVVAGDKAHCICHDPVTGKRFIVRFDLTPEELADYEKHPETFFGVHDTSSHHSKTPVDMFDFFFGVYKDTPKEKLLEFLAGSPDHAELVNLPQKDLAEILCERYVMHAVAQGAFQSQANKRRRRPPQ